MSAPLEASLGEHLAEVSTINPAAEFADREFTYIDLSAVDQATKAIVAPTHVTGTDAPSRARQVLAAGDIVVSTVRPNLNAVAPVEPVFDGAIGSTGFCVLRPATGLDGRYLFHWVRSSHFIARMVRQATGASYPAVSDRIVRASKIPFPPLDEQRRIARVLDAADALRATRRENITSLRELRDAIFYELFGDPALNPQAWPWGRVADIVESVDYGTSARAGAVGDHPVLRMGNLTVDGRIDLGDLKYLDLRPEDIPRYTVRAGDLLFNRTNSPDLVGKTAVYREGPPVAFAGYLIRVRTRRQHDPEYLAAFLNTRYGKRTLRGMCKSIVGMANINARELQRMAIPIVPSDLQQEFSRSMSALERERTRLLGHASELDALFASLQARAFAGEL